MNVAVQSANVSGSNENLLNFRLHSKSARANLHLIVNFHD